MDYLKCPSCGHNALHNRNITGPELYKCEHCEERYTREELEEIGYDFEQWDIGGIEDYGY